jgi:hypothetical protein
MRKRRSETSGLPDTKLAVSFSGTQSPVRNREVRGYTTIDGLTVDHRLRSAGEHLKISKYAYSIGPVEGARVRAGSNNLPKQRVNFSVRELDNHLPTLLNTIIDALEG